MKKFSKILAVLMTVCLLFGVVAAFGTSAAVASSSKESDLFVKASANSTGTMPTPVNRFWATFDNGVLAATATTVSVTKGTETHTYTDAFARGGSSTQRFQIGVSGASKSYPAGLNHVQLTGGEGYIAIRKVPGSFRVTDSEGNLVNDFTFSNGKAISAFAPEYYLTLAHNASWSYFKPNAQHFDSLRYATVDFDYGTDRWAYQVDGVWETGITVPADADPESVRPANAAGSIALSLTEFNYADDTAWVKQKNNSHIQMVVAQDAATGNYFLSGAGTTWDKDTEYNDGEDMWLSNQPGVLDHFTIVLDVTTENEQSTGKDIVTATTAHIFVNGEHFTSKTLSLTTKNFGLHSVYFYVAQLSSRLEDNSLYKENDRYSLVVDNVVPNYYKKYVDASNTGYQYFDSANGSYGLDDYLASADVYKNVNLSKCPDTLYGIYETRDDAIAIIDGAKHKVLGSSVDLGDMISNNSTVTLPAGKAFTASPAADVASFNVTLGDGATLTTKSGAYKAVESDGTYALTKIATKANVSLFTDMAFNLYVPADAGFTADGFVDTTIEEVAYKQYTWNPELGSFDSASVTLNYGAVSSVINLDVVKYATLVADEFDCNTAQAKLAYEIMDYKVAVAEYLDSDFDAANVASLQAFYALYSEHADCNCGSAAEIDNAVINKGILEGKTISFLLESGKFSIVFGGFTAHESVTVAIGVGEGAYNATLTANADGEVVFNDVNAALLRYTFSVTATAGAGEYRLSAYIAALGDGADKNLAVAMYEYSLAVYNFKTLPVEN